MAMPGKTPAFKEFIKIHITSLIKGQKPTTNYNISDLANGDWLTQMIDLPNMPWSMALGKSMYTSNDTPTGDHKWKISVLNGPKSRGRSLDFNLAIVEPGPTQLG